MLFASVVRRPIMADDDQILAAIKIDCHLTTREIAEHFGIDHTIVAKRLKKLAVIKKPAVSVPYELSEKTFWINDL